MCLMPTVPLNALETWPGPLSLSSLVRSVTGTWSMPVWYRLLDQLDEGVGSHVQLKFVSQAFPELAEGMKRE